MPQRTPRLLVVDDNPGDLELLRFAVESSDFPVDLRMATDGELALQEMRRSQAAGDPPDLVLLDLNMPRCSGFEVLATMRNEGICVGVPVVVWISSLAPRDRERSLAEGAVEVLAKPEHIEGYTAMMERLKARLPA